jgi:hypothetical protein
VGLFDIGLIDVDNFVAPLRGLHGRGAATEDARTSRRRKETPVKTKVDKTKVDKTAYQPFGEQPWRTLVKAHPTITFASVAQRADTSYGRVIRMSRGEVETTPAVRDALVKLFGRSEEQLLTEAAALRAYALGIEDGGRDGS